MNAGIFKLGFFELSDGRLWDVRAAKFVPSAPDGASPCAVLDEAHLERVLREEGLPLGKFSEAYADAERDVLAARDACLSGLCFRFERLEEYRRKLLEIPDQPGYPFDVEWPSRPW